MTREEAIEVIKQDIPCEYDTDLIEALNMAIKALEQEPCEDAVSRADTLQSFENYCEKNCQYSKKQRNVMCGACMMGDAIEIVENLPPVTPKARNDMEDMEELDFIAPKRIVGKMISVDVLDKIRAEIAEYKDDKIIHAERNEMIDIVLEIIDKYRGEQK